jgi:hypothetical protein
MGALARADCILTTMDYDFDEKIYLTSIKEKIMTTTTELLPEFPIKSGVDMKDIMLTEEGKYSYTKRRDGDLTIDFFKKHLGSLKSLTILDGTGNVGGDTILFGLNFKHVDSIELDEENFKALKHNVGLYKLTNVDLHHGDTTKLFEKFKTDVVYFDPPWGGPDYKKKKELDLFLGKHRVDLFLKNEVLSEKNTHKPKYVILKVPFNFNSKRLDTIKQIEDSHILRIRNYRIMILKIKEEKKEIKVVKESKEEKSIIEHIEPPFKTVKKRTAKRSRSYSRPRSIY